ncbi:hypothetical protein V8E54_004431 [Elaphomyces granulatus]
MLTDPNLEPEVAQNGFSCNTQTEGSILTPAEEDDIPSENVVATLEYFHDHFMVPVEYLNQIYHDRFDPKISFDCPDYNPSAMTTPPSIPPLEAGAILQFAYHIEKQAESYSWQKACLPLAMAAFKHAHKHGRLDTNSWAIPPALYVRPKTAPTANEFEDLKKKCKKYHEYLRRLLVAIYIAEHGTSIGIYDIGVICEQKVEDLIRMNEHDDDVDAILQVRGALGLPRPTVKQYIREKKVESDFEEWEHYEANLQQETLVVLELYEAQVAGL